MLSQAGTQTWDGLDRSVYRKCCQSLMLWVRFW